MNSKVIGTHITLYKSELCIFQSTHILLCINQEALCYEEATQINQRKIKV